MTDQEQLDAAAERIENVQQGVWGAIARAAGAMPPVAKSGRNEFDKYDYSTIGDYAAAVRAPMATEGLAMVVTDAKPEYFETKSPKMPKGCRVSAMVVIGHGSTGQTVSFGPYYGEGWDRGDKCFYKAMTGLRKYALAAIFNLQAEGDEPEADSITEQDLEHAANLERQREAANRLAAQQDAPPVAQDAPAAPADSAAPISPDELEARVRRSLLHCTTTDAVEKLLSQWIAREGFSDNVDQRASNALSLAARYIESRKVAGMFDAEESEGLVAMINAQLAKMGEGPHF